MLGAALPLSECWGHFSSSAGCLVGTVGLGSMRRGRGRLCGHPVPPQPASAWHWPPVGQSCSPRAGLCCGSPMALVLFPWCGAQTGDDFTSVQCVDKVILPCNTVKWEKSIKECLLKSTKKQRKCVCLKKREKKRESWWQNNPAALR